MDGNQGVTSTEGVRLLELAHDAQRLFANQNPREKRRLLNFTLSNCAWVGGEIEPTYRQPFALLAETVEEASTADSGMRVESGKSEIWLGN